MFYYLYNLRDLWSPLNVFQYITFRTGGAVVTAFVLAILMGPALIAKLKKRKICQIQRTDGPSTHMAKHGTPTMGGLLILMCLVSATLLWAKPDNRFVWLLLWTTGLLAMAGGYDDYVKLVRGNPAGASSRLKLTIQLLAAVTVVGYLAAYPPNPGFATTLGIPYTKQIYINLFLIYYAFAMLVIVGTSNAVNLTDGLDGLATGNLVLCALTFGALAYIAGNAKFASYLMIIPVEGAGEICVFMGAMVGACLGFLWFNTYPAQVFMGDTSSLFLGGAIGVAAICIKQELLLPIAGGIFVIETLSVILQMSSYKFRKKKRIFLMAPLHHHFELKGWAEPKVTVRFWIVGIMLMLAALASLKIR